MVKTNPKELLAFLESASMQAKRMALAIFPLFCKHGFARISQATLGKRLGYHRQTMCDAGDELHNGGFVWKINQQFVNGKPTCCEYEGMASCFSIEVIEFLFGLARSLKVLSFWMLYTFRNVLKYATTPLLSSSHIYESLNNYNIFLKRERFSYKNLKKEKTSKLEPPKLNKINEVLAAKPKKSLQTGKTILVNNQDIGSTPRETKGFKNINDIIAELLTAAEARQKGM